MDFSGAGRAGAERAGAGAGGHGPKTNAAGCPKATGRAVIPSRMADPMDQPAMSLSFSLRDQAGIRATAHVDGASRVGARRGRAARIHSAVQHVVGVHVIALLRTSVG